VYFCGLFDAQVLWYNLCILPIFDPILIQKWGKKCMKNTGLNKNCVCS